MNFEELKKFYGGKKVLLTGHTGFKGSWLSKILIMCGAKLTGYALDPPTDTSIFDILGLETEMNSVIGDIRDLEHLKKVFDEVEPEYVIHMAAQPIVRDSYERPVYTYETNVMGTVNVLEAARYAPQLKSVVIITTDKCYENREWEWGYRENEPMGGHDPYSNSKGCAELVVSAYRRSFFYTNDTAAVASARAGNVIGGGDWADDRLIPDILRAFEQQQPVIIRNPLSTRPWQHVLEPLSGYLVLAERLYNEGNAFAEGWNFGPKDDDCQPVQWILEKMVQFWGEGARYEWDKSEQPHEANFLKLDCSKAATRLKWHPQWRLADTLEKIVHWHRSWLQGADMQTRCLYEIKGYMES